MVRVTLVHCWHRLYLVAALSNNLKRTWGGWFPKTLFLSFGPQFSLKIRGTGRAVKGVSYSSGKSTEKRELFVNLSDHIRTRDADKRRTYVLLLVLYLESPFSRTNKCALKVFLFLAGSSDFIVIIFQHKKRKNKIMRISVLQFLDSTP